MPEAEVAVGPALDGLDGRKSGTVEGYDYSEVNKNSGSCGAKQRSRSTDRSISQDPRNEDDFL